MVMNRHAFAVLTAYVFAGRLALAQEPSIPSDLQARIDRQGCTNNPSLQQKTIAYGEFAARGQRDWVALCAFDGSWILFYRWGGPAKCEGDGVHFLAKMTLERSSLVAMRRLAQQQERKVPLLVHDGIVESDAIETATLYCSAGLWTEVTRQRQLDADTLAALRRLVRRPPNDFPKIPEPVRDRMTADGCRILKRLIGTGFNLISGQFARRGQVDWAVICSGNARWSIRVYWGGDARCGPLDQEGENFELLDERTISTVSSTQLQKMQAAHPDGPGVARFTHDSVNFGSEKGSTAYYCNAGKWLSVLTGD